MAKTRQQKEEQVTRLTDKLKQAKSVVFADYRGLKMSQLSDLRNKLVDEQAEFSVTKNTLLGISLKESGYQAPNKVMEGPIATLFSFGDEVAPLKTLVKTLKDTGIGKITGGFFGGNFMDEYSLVRLSALPSKLELQGKVVGILAAPLYGLANVLQGNLRNLVYVLSAIADKRQGSGSTS